MADERPNLTLETKSFTLAELERAPGFCEIDGDVDGTGYNETTVDIIAVPCPGADPIDTWARAPLPEGFFETPQTPAETNTALTGLVQAGLASSVANRRPRSRSPHLWIRQGIRSEVSIARVMIYRHRQLTQDLTLDTLAEDLLEQLSMTRNNDKPRPIFFLAHSIGGLVVKLALVKSAQISRFRPIMYHCHGVTFFATPHRGSSYLSTPTLSMSIQRLLRLEAPLPPSISSQLRLGYKPLLELHAEFVEIASELDLWSFYETVESQLSGVGSAVSEHTRSVEFGVPLVSIKSSLIGAQWEQVYALDSDHAHCASFGENNSETMSKYLQQLADAAQAATDLTSTYMHHPLNLTQHVRVEVIGFYDDFDVDVNSDIRLYYTKVPLAEFLVKGPDECLSERLGIHSGVDPSSRQRNLPDLSVVANEEEAGLGLVSRIQKTARSLSGNDAGELTSRQSSHDSSRSRSGSVSARAASLNRAATLAVPPANAPNYSKITSAPSGAQEVSKALAGEPVAGASVAEADVTASGDEDGHDVAVKDFEPGLAAPGPITNQHAVLEALMAGFSHPDPDRRRFMWIHTPFNNPPWVKDVFEKLSETLDRNFDRLFSNEHWISRHLQSRRAVTQPPFVNPACGLIPAEVAGSNSTPGTGTPRVRQNSFTRNLPTTFYLYLPFLHFDTYINMLRRRNLIKRRMAHGRARPVPADIAELDSLEHRVIWQFVEYDPPLNVRRTLDQYGYPSLRDTDARDDDQILYKLTKESNENPQMKSAQRQPLNAFPQAPKRSRRPSSLASETTFDPFDDDISDSGEDLEKLVKDGKVLMVDQLWLWAIDTTTVVSFFSKRESRPTEGPLFQQGDLRNSVYNELNGDLTQRCENAFDLAAFIVLHAITVFLDRTSHPDLEVFRIFEEAIGLLTEKMTSAFRRFRMQTYREAIGEQNEDSEPNSTASIKKRHKRELHQAERENRENTSALLELRDIEDELMTLLKLFRDQETVVRQMAALYRGPELKAHTQNGLGFLHEALKSLDLYKKQTQDMLQRVETTRNDYEKLLEMAQRKAQVDEVRWSRLQAELASSQNLSVMIFTTFTVIFLPLTFFTGLFGMNTKEWGGDDNMSIVDIGAISLPTSFSLIILSLVAAFSSRVQLIAKSAYQEIMRILGHTGLVWTILETKKQREKREAKRRSWEAREERKRRRRDGGYDFWAAVKKQRDIQYFIPEINRKREVAGTVDGAELIS